MITRELESHLTKLEIGLHNFSFETLGADEAISLKYAFEVFKNELYSKTTNSIDSLFRDSADDGVKLAKINRLIKGLLKYVQHLKKNDTTIKQPDTIAAIELAASIILLLTMSGSTE
ncbi:hypothetical protein [Allomuricauda sp. d1]|uniref:hypothetical protein n=1 Tax=Allomuricauda sp. d1 TaxID=3136725 RepID=UPI0031CEDB3E